MYLSGISQRISFNRYSISRIVVYHGLGTGKTASASLLLKIYQKICHIRTLLPASLEGEFIKEIKIWGKNEIDLYNTKWRHIPSLKYQKTKRHQKNDI